MANFVNPYNFIPFGEDIQHNKQTKNDKYSNQNTLKSGWIEVTLNTKTPLIIPDGAHPKYFDCKERKYVNNPSENEKKYLHREYGFMKRKVSSDMEEEYYIPGSSIRGMLRNVYEAATDSCVPFLLKNPENPISQRIPLYAALKKRGLLTYEKDKDEKWVWRLYKAKADVKEVMIKSEKKTIKVGNKEIEKTNYSLHRCDKNNSIITDKTGDYIEEEDAYIQYNIPVNTEQPYHVAYLKKGEVVYTWDDDEPYRQLKSVLWRDGVKGNQNNPNHGPKKDLLSKLEEANQKKNNMVPVYYFTVTRKIDSVEQTIVYLSNSAAGRIAQKRNWEDIIGEHKPCKGENLCPACLLFGNMIGKYGLKSKVRVSDALPLGNLSTNKITLGVLGEPRTSAFEYYLERRMDEGKAASYWNFDFYGVSEIDKKGVSHTKYYDLPHAMPRGRKMYWHGKPVSSNKKSKMNQTVQAAGENQKFSFRIYYDEITSGQLQDLIWTITLGDNSENSKLQHKLGHAKPLGYGSVKLTVDKVVERKIQYSEDEGITVALKEVDLSEDTKLENIDLNSQIVKSILKITDATITKELLVQYPRATQDNYKIYEWFSNNRKNPKCLQVLPKVLDSRITNASNGKNKQDNGKENTNGKNNNKGRR